MGDEPSKAEGSGISRGDGVVTHQGRLKGVVDGGAVDGVQD